MDDLISRQAAIDTDGLDEEIRCEMCRNPMHNDRGCDGNCIYDEKLYEKIIQILDKRIKQLPSAQPDSKELSFTHKALDTISRQDAIRIVDGIDTWQAGWRGDAIESMKALPSAQPETHEERTKTHSCDCISRQAAIDAILAVTGNSSVRELYEHVQEHGLSDMWSGGVNAAIDVIIAVPSAQPEKVDTPTVDTPTVDTPNCEDTISRQGAIRVASGFCHPANIAKELAKLPSAQPDLSEYSDKLWQKAYERGKAEAQDEIVRCENCKNRGDDDCPMRFIEWVEYDDDGYIEHDDIIHDYTKDDGFCDRAERRTDEAD